MLTRIRTALSRDGKHAYEVIEPLETLAQKVGQGRGFAPGALERASALVEEMAEGYPELVRAELAKLRALATRAREPEADAKPCWAEAKFIAHELRSQGSTYGFPLVTAIAEQLYRLLRDHPELSGDAAGVVEAHIDAVAAVVSGNVRGDGGSLGRELVASLAAMRARCTS